MATNENFPSLPDLINGVIAGDEVAQWQLRGRYEKRLFRFLKGRLAVNRCPHPHEDGEEIANFVWRKAVDAKKLKNLKDPRNFPGWLYRTAKRDTNRHLRNCVKKATGRLSYEDCDPSELQTAQIVPGDRALEAKERLGKILKIAKSSKDPRLYPIVLFRAQGYAYAEIAKKLDITEAYARTLCRRGLVKINAILDQRNNQV